MATKAITITQVGDDLRQADWAAMATGDDGQPMGDHQADFSERTVHVRGTFSGATVAIQGSNDGTNWVTLPDGAGSACSFTAEGCKKVGGQLRYLRPAASAGTGSGLLVTLFMRREPRLP